MDNDKNETINSVLNADISFDNENDIIDLDKYKKIPIAGIAAMGCAFAALPESFRKVTQMVNTNLGEKLYRRIDSIPAEMARCKDGSGIITSVIYNGKTAQAKLEEVTNIDMEMTSIIPYNPQPLFMAAALMEIEMTLRDVQEKAENILEFIEEDKKAQLRGNLNTLQEIKKNYQYNFGNEMVLSNYHMKVLDIKNNAVQNIEFYKKIILSKLNKKELIPNLHIGANVDDKLKAVQKELDNYQLALFVFSFSSLLEVLISKNFDTEFLNSIIEELENKSFEYKQIYTDCYNIIDGDADSAIDGDILNGMAKAGKAVGKALDKVELIRKVGVGKAISSAGQKLDKYADKIENKAHKLKSNRSSMVAPFTESLRTVDKLYNAPVNVLMDNEFIYYLSEV